MKRPISFVLVATLLAGASAYAGNDARGVEGKIAREVVRNNDKDHGNRGHDRRVDGGGHRRAGELHALKLRARQGRVSASGRRSPTA